ncbi:hypothetical protein [Mycobacterium sp. GA-2829]|uniref:hypothetical protein n=1 Tax=Mycobacterium sp. GA-2829 TaxID=1772283 RepID=UPI00074013E8|nr:hypothetical protein [Mycobacterium sp. GA-2829]KUI37099.1 secretion protein EspD [Mycobacterium sp. GA-2829]
MAGDFAPQEPEDDLSALDFYQPVPAEAEDSELVALDAFTDHDPAAEPEPLFTVTNPPGTVTVTTYLDGRVQYIQLSPQVAHMTERELAEEIMVIAGLATQDAKSAQYQRMLDGMREQGHDDPATRDFLQRDLQLPTPDEARARRAEVFTTRYAGSHE